MTEGSETFAGGTGQPIKTCRDCDGVCGSRDRALVLDVLCAWLDEHVRSSRESSAKLAKWERVYEVTEALYVAHTGQDCRGAE